MLRSPVRPDQTWSFFVNNIFPFLQVLSACDVVYVRVVDWYAIWKRPSSAYSQLNARSDLPLMDKRRQKSPVLNNKNEMSAYFPWLSVCYPCFHAIHNTSRGVCDDSTRTPLQEFSAITIPCPKRTNTSPGHCGRSTVTRRGDRKRKGIDVKVGNELAWATTFFVDSSSTSFTRCNCSRQCVNHQ